MAIVEKTFKSGEVIIREGEAGTTLFRLLSGNIGIYTEYGKKEQFRIAFLKSGGYFGEQAIIETSPRSATVVAECSVKVLEIPGNELTSFLKENPAGFSEPNAETFKQEFKRIKNEGPVRILTRSKGEIIYNPGDVQDCMYIVRSGKVALYKNYGTKEAEKVTDLNEVSFFGEMGMILDLPRETTAVVESDEARVEVIYKKDLEEVFRVCPIKINTLLTHLSFRLRHLTIDFLDICKDITSNYS